MGHEAAGVVDELGEGVTDVAVGDRVFGFSAEGAAQAELAVLSYYAPIPPSLDFPGAAALPAAIETATRALDQLGVGSGSTLLINGASGSVGSAAVQLAVVRGARVIGTASPANHEYLRSLGAEPVAYGEGLVERVRALAPDGVDVALDVAGSGVLPELIELAGGPEHVVTIADFAGAREHGVTVQQRGRRPRGPRARRDRRADRVRALLAPGRADLPARRDRGGAPRRRGRSRAREARAGGGLALDAGRRTVVVLVLGALRDAAGVFEHQRGDDQGECGQRRAAAHAEVAPGERFVQATTPGRSQRRRTRPPAPPPRGRSPWPGPPAGPPPAARPAWCPAAAGCGPVSPGRCTARPARAAAATAPSSTAAAAARCTGSARPPT